MIKCGKCKKNVKSLYIVAVAPKLQASLCNECINAWFDLRDKLIADAFREYLPVSKSK